MTCYSVQPRDCIFIKGYGLLSLARNRGNKISKNLSIIRSQKLLDQRKQPATDALKTASKSAIHKTAEASDSFIDNKTAERFRKVSKTSLQNKEEIVKLIR